MRKITSDSINAFNNEKNFKGSNMEVLTANDLDGIKTTYLYLHGNMIAFKDKTGLYIDCCGWKTNTTKERLNGLSGVSITQKNYCWFLNGYEWDGKLTKV